MRLDNKKVEMLEPFVLDDSLKNSASKIARDKKLNQKSVQLFLNSLEKQGILQFEFQGKNKLFFWNKNNKSIVRQFILTIENLRTINFYQKQPLVKKIMEKIYPNVNGIAIIFGSFADNSQTNESDIDLLIIGKYDEAKIRDIINLYDIAISIKNMKMYKINPLTKEVQKKHIIIKNAESYINEAIEWIN